MAGDSGLAVGCHGLMGEQGVHDEDGLRLPFILSGRAAIDRGRRVDAPSYVHDTNPTTCELAGLPVPECVNGRSLVPVIQGRVAPSVITPAMPTANTNALTAKVITS